MSPLYRAGLVLLGLLALSDLASPLMGGEGGPPLAIVLGTAVLGLVSLVLIVPVWRGPSKTLYWLLALRILSALTALPAFIVPDVPGLFVGIGAAFIVLTAAGVAFTLIGAKRTAVTT